MKQLQCFFCKKWFHRKTGRSVHMNRKHPKGYNDRLLMEQLEAQEAAREAAEAQVDPPPGITPEPERPGDDEPPLGSWTEFEDSSEEVCYWVECEGQQHPEHYEGDARNTPPLDDFTELGDALAIAERHAIATGHVVSVTRRRYAVSTFTPAKPPTEQKPEPALEEAPATEPEPSTSNLNPVNPALKKDTARLMPP